MTDLAAARAFRDPTATLPGVSSSSQDGERGTWASRLSEDALRCRDVGHPWSDWTARWDPDLRAYQQTLRCLSCGTSKTRLISRTGEILSSSYAYADGYLAPPGVDVRSADGRAALRLTHVLRYAQEPGGGASKVTPIRRGRKAA